MKPAGQAAWPDSAPADVAGREERIAPAPRISVQAFCETVETAAAIQAAGEDRRMAKAHLRIQMGGLIAAVEAYQNAPTPSVIILESEALNAWGASLWQRCFAGFRTASLHVRRAKQGTPSTHPIVGDELRALRRLQRDQEPKSPFVFTSERGTPFTTAGFARMIDRAATRAKLAIKPHPHMLRHACGYALANRGHDTRALQAYLGHKNIQHTVRYTELSPTRFKNFWRQ